MLVPVPTPASRRSTRGNSAVSMSITVSSPGRTVNRIAAEQLGLSRSACTTMLPVPFTGRSSQKARKAGNSSPAGSPVLIDNPRADSP